MNLQNLPQQIIEGIQLQRAEILTAFIAKYGFEPDKCVQVTQTTADGRACWCVLKLEE